MVAKGRAGCRKATRAWQHMHAWVTQRHCCCNAAHRSERTSAKSCALAYTPPVIRCSTICHVIGWEMRL